MLNPLHQSLVTYSCVSYLILLLPDLERKDCVKSVGA